MAGFTTNRKSNHEIEQDTGYVRAGQGGKRHRFDIRGAAKKTTPQMPSLRVDDSDADAGADSLTGEGPLDQDATMPDINAMAGMPEPTAHHAPAIPGHAQHAPVAVHIHLSPSDHRAFSGMAGKKKAKAPKC